MPGAPTSFAYRLGHLPNALPIQGIASHFSGCQDVALEEDAGNTQINKGTTLFSLERAD
jgi:hypothetical protein